MRGWCSVGSVAGGAGVWPGGAAMSGYLFGGWSEVRWCRVGGDCCAGVQQHVGGGEDVVESERRREAIWEDEQGEGGIHIYECFIVWVRLRRNLL